jgi:hypothetical protein
VKNKNYVVFKIILEYFYPYTNCNFSFPSPISQINSIQLEKNKIKNMDWSGFLTLKFIFGIR